MTKFEEEFNYLIELSGKVLIGQVDAEAFEKNRIAFFEKYETNQQQALPVVPEFMVETIECEKQANISISDTLAIVFSCKDNVLTKTGLWTKNNPEQYIAARTIGYTVQNTKRFYLKHIDMSKADKELDYYLAKDDDGTLSHDMPNKGQFPWHPESRFTQEEIDSMQTGSYEKVEVEE